MIRDESGKSRDEIGNFALSRIFRTFVADGYVRRPIDVLPGENMRHGAGAPAAYQQGDLLKGNRSAYALGSLPGSAVGVP